MDLFNDLEFVFGVSVKFYLSSIGSGTCNVVLY